MPTKRQACEGKIRYDSRSDAKAAAKHMRQRYGREFGHYHCKLCGRWHVGSKTGAPA